MQLTARQREFVRIAGWALPVSITLGAVFGHFQAQNGSVWGYVQGAVAAIVISCTILLLEFAVFSRTRSALARRMPFLLYLALRSLGYLAATLMGLAVSAWLLRESAERPLIERSGVVFSLVLSLGFNLLFGVNAFRSPIRGCPNDAGPRPASTLICVAPRSVSMMCSFLVSSGLMMLGRFPVMACSMRQMF